MVEKLRGPVFRGRVNPVADLLGPVLKQVPAIQCSAGYKRQTEENWAIIETAQLKPIVLQGQEQ